MYGRSFGSEGEEEKTTDSVEQKTLTPSRVDQEEKTGKKGRVGLCVRGPPGGTGMV